MGSMFPSLSEDTITAVLEAQGGDADKACDELLNMAVGDDLFNRSIYIEDNLSASQNLQRFDKQQEDIKKQEREAEVLKQERIKLEIQAEKDALAAQKAELEARAKTEADELAKIASEKAALEEELRKMRE